MVNTLLYLQQNIYPLKKMRINFSEDEILATFALKI